MCSAGWFLQLACHIEHPIYPTEKQRPISALGRRSTCREINHEVEHDIGCGDRVHLWRADWKWNRRAHKESQRRFDWADYWPDPGTDHRFDCCRANGQNCGYHGRYWCWI